MTPDVTSRSKVVWHRSQVMNTGRCSTTTSPTLGQLPQGGRHERLMPAHSRRELALPLTRSRRTNRVCGIRV